MSTTEDVKSKIRALNPENKFFRELELTYQQQHFEREQPQSYLQRICELFAAIGGNTIVEIGCMRNVLKHPIEEIHPECCNDGHSTYVWCTTGANVISVDISRRAVWRARRSCREFDNCRIVRADGLKFLETCTAMIDLLYLDAWNVHAHIPYAESHLIAYLKAKDRLSERNIIAMDDTDIASGGKGKYLIPYLQHEGYEILVQGRQTIALRETT